MKILNKLQLTKKQLLKISAFGILLNINPTYAQTIEEVLKLTLKNSPELLQKEALQHKQKHDLQEKLGGYFPQIDLSAARGRDTNNNATTQAATGSSLTLTKKENGISLNQMLFDGFGVKSAVEANAARLKSATHDVYTNMENIALSTIEAYLEILRLRIHVKLSKESLANHQNIFQQIQLRSESGISKKADLEQAAARLALARTNLLEQQATLQDAESNFRRLTGFAPEVLIRPELADEILPASEDTAVVMALQNHPSLEKAKANILAARADKHKVRAAFFPSLSLQVSGAQNKNIDGQPGKDNSFSVMLRANYNIFRGGSDRAQEHAAAWALEESKEELRQTRREIEQSTRIAWNAYSNTKNQLQYQKEHAEAIQKTRDAYQDQFNIGQRTLLDLLDAENELLSAKTSYVSAQYVTLLGKYRILASIGKLVKQFRLPIPETAIYTPNKWIDGF